LCAAHDLRGAPGVTEATMRIEVRERVPADQTEVVWNLYNDAFEELRATAVQRHVMIRDEFDEVMADRRVDKYIAIDNTAGNTATRTASNTASNTATNTPNNTASNTGDDRVRAGGNAGPLSALATLTNELDAMPLISPDYFRNRWPQLFEERRIWYIGFVAVHPRYRSSGVFDQVVGELYRTVLGKGPDAVAALDVCGRNEEYRLPQAIHRLLDSMRLSMVRSDRMDAQSYWCYEFS
jgi:hypothetical protein